MLPIKKQFIAVETLQLHRLKEFLIFTCDRCKQEKKSKLVAIVGEDWSRKFCNGCYGRTLAQKVNIFTGG